MKATDLLQTLRTTGTVTVGEVTIKHKEYYGIHWYSAKRPGVKRMKYTALSKNRVLDWLETLQEHEQEKQP